MLATALTCESQRVFDGVCRFISQHDPTGVAGPVVERLIDAVGIFLLVYLAGRVVRRIADTGMRRGESDRQVQTLVHNVLAAITITAALLCALVVAGVDFGVVLTAAGVGSIAVGLAFQDYLRNILAGIWLLVEHPFRLGDSIAVLDQSGVVQNITLRTTTLRTGDGRLAVLPNLTVFTNPVVNASTYQLRQFSISVRQPPDANLDDAMRRARAVLDGVPAVARTPAPSVLPQLDAEAMLVQCRFWIDQTAADPDAVTAEVARRLWAEQAAAGEVRADQPR